MGKWVMVSILSLVLAVPAFADSADRKRSKIQNMRKEVLAELYEKKPQAKGEIKNAAGYAVFIFHTRKAFDDFVEHGWDFSGQADAAAKADDKGASGEGAGTVVPGVTLYQMTKSGLALQATLQGTKYWKSDKLN